MCLVFESDFMYKKISSKIIPAFLVFSFTDLIIVTDEILSFLAFPGDPLLQTFLSVHSAPRAQASHRRRFCERTQGVGARAGHQLHGLWEPHWPPAEGLRSTSLPGGLLDFTLKWL